MEELLIRSTANAYADVLRNIIKGADVEYVGRAWDDIYAGNVLFESQGWKFTIFNDCDDIDYTDELTSPAGVRLDFDMMFDNQCDPVRWMDIDTEALKEKLVRATNKIEAEE